MFTKIWNPVKIIHRLEISNNNSYMMFRTTIIRNRFSNSLFPKSDDKDAASQTPLRGNVRCRYFLTQDNIMVNFLLKVVSLSYNFVFTVFDSEG
jgi:hypothetical protein